MIFRQYECSAQEEAVRFSRGFNSCSL